jgi:hypothetical protein
MTERPHELVTFMLQDALQMQSEYERIRSVSTEDPGTAGDEGEETWAHLLRDWLPESYQVVTKGRLLAADGRRGPQVDLLVLRPGYPRRLIDKKVYLIAGVAAAFECKNTLKAVHIAHAFEQAAKIDDLSSPKAATPFNEMVPEVYFGLLAHSTVWKSEPDNLLGRVDTTLQAGLNEMAGPRSAPSLVCIADLGVWSVMHMTYDGPGLYPDQTWQARVAMTGLPPEGSAHLSYIRFVEGTMAPNTSPPTPIAAAVSSILSRLAHDDATVRPLSQYFMAAGLGGSGASVASRVFPLSDYSPEIRAQLPRRLTNGVVGSEWSMGYSF